MSSSSIAARLQALEGAVSPRECGACGWPLPANVAPSREWFGRHPHRFAKIDLDRPAPELLPAPTRCEACGRSFPSFTLNIGGPITLDGDKEPCQ